MAGKSKKKSMYKSLRINGKKLQRIKCVTVGDAGVGKTCLLVSYTTNTLPEKYVPTVFENHSVNVKVDDNTVKLELWDTAGSEEYALLRPLSYDKADVFIVCYSIDRVESFENVEKMWYPDIRQHSSDVPIFMVGTKADIREDRELIKKLREQGEEVTNAQGHALAEKVGMQFMEVSALSQKGLKLLFDNVIRFGLVYKQSLEESTPGCVLF